jgi:hypothetical protein
MNPVGIWNREKPGHCPGFSLLIPHLLIPSQAVSPQV